MKVFFVSIRNPERITVENLTSINNTRLVSSAGFSVLEFIIVMAVLCALMSIFISKFEDFHDEAHVAKVQMTASSLQSAVNLTHRLWQSYGSINDVTLLRGYGNDNVVMSQKGWPVNAIFEHNDVVSNKKLLLQNTDKCKNLWRALLKENEGNKEGTSEIDGEVKNTSAYLTEWNQGICRYQYLLSNKKLRIEYNLATGQVTPFL